MKKILIAAAVLICVIAASFMFFAGKDADRGAVTEEIFITAEDAKETEGAEDLSEPEVRKGEIGEKEKSLMRENGVGKKQTVPFIVQAPFANWEDPIFQNACEEASMIMAMGWVESAPSFSPQEAYDLIKKLVEFEDENLGYNTDTDTKDMEKIFREYFRHEKIASKENISIGQIKNELERGNIVLVPTFGRALGNLNYTSPGPVTHMLVIIAYDEDKKQFVTNDPGTRKGKDYRYDENVLFDAIWEYPSGPILPDPPKGNLKKSMLVVSK
ncbi:MAG TPA: C39 family peptidase [Candidatus Moranbacteria bacterium]|jgi:uncharacterized protein YxeA|nr:hypothetical protein [Candidatus Moranbacteria bacterium]HPX94572.1 C39 family peptidase [Candidatus Moranbacteria bacterium]HQB59550.1 C39 family peptidase [Candidatus Moranbacteria bacterium]